MNETRETAPEVLEAKVNDNKNRSWNDVKCYEISQRDCFPSLVYDINIQKELITQFFNFYLSGKISKGLMVSDVVFAAISIMPLYGKEQFIWPSLEYEDHGTLFHISAEHKLRAEIKKIQCQKEENIASTINAEEEEKQDEEKHKNASKVEIENDNLNHAEEIGDLEMSKDDQEKFHDIVQDNIDAEKNGNEQNSEPQSTHESNFGETENKKENILNNELPLGIQWASIKNRQQKILSYGPKENASFTAHCNKLLGEWDKDEQARIQLKSIFGYVALTLMRATAKSPKHLTNTFSSERFITSMQQLIVWNGPFSIPDKKCISKSHRVLSKKVANIPIMFAKIVFWGTHKLESEENTDFRNKIIRATVLSHTSNFGMGILNMLQTLGNSIGDKGLNVILEVTTSADTKVSWVNLKEFINQYMVDTSKNVTYHWARILDDNALNFLGCRDNYALAVIFSVFIEKKFENSRVWDSSWIAKNSEQLEYYKALGAKMYETFRAKFN